jgi:hypothetical protein
MINLIILFSKIVAVYIKNNYEGKIALLAQKKKILIDRVNFAAVFLQVK